MRLGAGLGTRLGTRLGTGLGSRLGTGLGIVVSYSFFDLIVDLGPHL